MDSKQPSDEDGPPVDEADIMAIARVTDEPQVIRQWLAPCQVNKGGCRGDRAVEWAYPHGEVQIEYTCLPSRQVKMSRDSDT